MRLKNAYAPFFREGISENRIALTRIVAFSLLLVASVFSSGPRAIFVALSGALGAACTLVAWRIAEKKSFLEELPCAFSLGLGCACMLPAAVDLWVPFLSAALAMLTTRLVFGAVGRNPLSAEALGYCFAALCFANLKNLYNIAMLSPEEQAVFSGGYECLFAASTDGLSLFSSVTPAESYSSMLSAAALLRAGADPKLSWGELLLLGDNTAIGAASSLLLCACVAWLVWRKAIVWRAALCYVASAAVLALAFPYDAVGTLLSPAYEVFTGLTLFAAVFICGDPVCAPHTKTAQCIFGIGCGALSVLLRRIGSVEGGEIFAVLLMCCVASSLDRLVWVFRSNGVSIHKKFNELVRTIRIRLKLKNALGESYAELYELEQESDEGRNGYEQ